MSAKLPPQNLLQRIHIRHRPMGQSLLNTIRRPINDHAGRDTENLFQLPAAIPRCAEFIPQVHNFHGFQHLLGGNSGANHDHGP